MFGSGPNGPPQEMADFRCHGLFRLSFLPHMFISTFLKKDNSQSVLLGSHQGSMRPQDLCVSASFPLHVLFGLFPPPRELLFPPAGNLGLPLLLPSGRDCRVLPANRTARCPREAKGRVGSRRPGLKAPGTTVRFFWS